MMNDTYASVDMSDCTCFEENSLKKWSAVGRLRKYAKLIPRSIKRQEASTIRVRDRCFLGGSIGSRNLIVWYKITGRETTIPKNKQILKTNSNAPVGEE